MVNNAHSEVLMKDVLLDSLKVALDSMLSKEHPQMHFDKPIQLEHTRDSKHGDFATNLALQLAKLLNAKPQDIAMRLRQNLPPLKNISKVEVAGPGFINFYVNHDNWQQVIKTVLSQGARYGRASDTGTHVQIEFVSANPTGPLHVGHGRGAAYGSCVANILKACGHHVNCEYYVNDAGRQIQILALSVWLNYLKACGETPIQLKKIYQGEYIGTYANMLLEQYGKKLVKTNLQWPDKTVAEVGDDPQNNEEKLLDACISLMQGQLGADNHKLIQKFATQRIIADIQKELAELKVRYDNWFLESDLWANKIATAIAKLEASGNTEERDGNLWFLSTRFGDDLDRVLRRKNGTPTYFAADVAYHIEKFKRKPHHIINVWGADHHGYVARIHAALKALGFDAERLEIRLVQMMNLRRGAKKIAMSTRSGQFVSLRTLREEVGNDATRFFYIMRRADQATDFDLELAKATDKDNPVYYIQYAHARLCSMQRTMTHENLVWEQSKAMDALQALDQPEESQLLRKISDYPDLIQRAGAQRAPHLLATFLNQLAAEFHAYYNKYRILVSDPVVRNARVALALAIKQVIANGLEILSIDAPDHM